jgi:uncharacterized protein YggU (UPF0235/DUF167 family)
VQDDVITVQIAAPPVDGEANKELVKYITRFLNLKNGDVELDAVSSSQYHKALQQKRLGLNSKSLITP